MGPSLTSISKFWTPGAKETGSRRLGRYKTKAISMQGAGVWSVWVSGGRGFRRQSLSGRKTIYSTSSMRKKPR